MGEVNGTWNGIVDSTVDSGGAAVVVTLTIETDGDVLKGSVASTDETAEIRDGKIAGDDLTFSLPLTQPIPMTLECSATIDGGTLRGTARGPFGEASFTATRLN